MIFNACFRYVTMLTYPFLKLFDWMTPLAALLARGWVSYAFLKSGLLKFDNWQSTLMLFTYEFQVPLLPVHLAAILGTAAETVLPILIILGLGGRFVVALLFAFNVVAAVSYPYLWTPDGLDGLMQHINWGVLLLLLMCFGTGKWSLDQLFILYSKKNSREGNRINETNEKLF